MAFVDLVNCTPQSLAFVAYIYPLFSVNIQSLQSAERKKKTKVKKNGDKKTMVIGNKEKCKKSVFRTRVCVPSKKQ